MRPPKPPPAGLALNERNRNGEVISSAPGRDGGQWLAVRAVLRRGAGVCSPTRASVLTGRANDRCGVLSHGYALRLQEKTIAQALRGVGYGMGHFDDDPDVLKLPQ